MKKPLTISLLACLPFFIGLPGWADPYSDQGELLYKQKDYKNAGRYLATSLQKNPINSRALYFSALCLYKLGNIAEARNGFQTIIQIFPTAPEATLARDALTGNVAEPPAIASNSTARTVNYAVKRTGSKKQSGDAGISKEKKQASADNTAN